MLGSQQLVVHCVPSPRSLTDETWEIKWLLEVVWRNKSSENTTGIFRKTIKPPPRFCRIRFSSAYLARDTRSPLLSHAALPPGRFHPVGSQRPATSGLGPLGVPCRSHVVRLPERQYQMQISGLNSVQSHLRGCHCCTDLRTMCRRSDDLPQL